MGGPKAMLDAGGRTFVTRLVESLAEGGCDPVVVVGASRDGPLAEEVAAGSARLLVNPGGEGGQIGSLRVALVHLGSPEVQPRSGCLHPGRQSPGGTRHGARPGRWVEALGAYDRGSKLQGPSGPPRTL